MLRRNLLKNLLNTKKNSEPLFQVLLLDNNRSDEVTVHEAKKVDYFAVKEHLNNGGSVFITSKNSQKISPQKNKPHTNYANSKRNYWLLLKASLRNSKTV
jgi:hypothetical protein